MEEGIEESNQEQNRSGRSQYYGGPPIDASNGLTAYQRASLIQRAEAEKQRAITTGIAKAAEGRAVDAEKRAVSRDSLNEKEQKIKIDIEEGKLRAANLEADRTLKVIEQGNGFLKDAYGMNPEDPRFDEQMQRMEVGYPLAFGTPGVSKGYPPVDEWLKRNMPIALLRRQNTLNENVKIEAEKRAEQAAARKFTDDQNKQVLENQAAGELAEKLNLKPTGISSSGKIVFGDAKEASQGTQTVVTDPIGMKTVTEKRPLGAPTQAPAATPAAPTASTTPTADPLAGIVSSGGKIKKVGDKYNAFDKDGKYLGTYSVRK